MINIIDHLDKRIQLEMSNKATSDPKILIGLRNIKSDFTYNKSKNLELSDIDILKKMYKSRQDTADIYKNVNNDLYMQEMVESIIIKPFLPEELSLDTIFEYFNTLNIEKSKTNFKLFQNKCEERFGQKIDSSIILQYIAS